MQYGNKIYILNDKKMPTIMFKFDFSNHLYAGNLKMYMMANREDPDKMQHNAAFHQDLHYLLRLKHNLLGQK